MSTGQYVGEEKGRCELCQREFHISLLMKQEGHLRCIVSCVDDLSNKYRRKRISEVLADGANEGSSDKPKIFQDPGEVVFE